MKDAKAKSKPADGIKSTESGGNKGVTAKKAALCLALCLLIIAVSDLFLPTGDCGVYDNVIRLHIIANSDSDEDQKIKLAVKDEIMQSGVFKKSGTSGTMEEAKTNTETAAGYAVGIANSFLEKQNAGYRASCRWGVESYPTREYEGIRLPAGKYLSLRIVLGEGKGQNWWCVLFPQLCESAYQKPSGDKPGNAVFYSKNKKYKFRFKLLEWLFA